MPETRVYVTGEDEVEREIPQGVIAELKFNHSAGNMTTVDLTLFSDVDADSLGLSIFLKDRPAEGGDNQAG